MVTGKKFAVLVLREYGIMMFGLLAVFSAVSAFTAEPAPGCGRYWAFAPGWPAWCAWGLAVGLAVAGFAVPHVMRRLWPRELRRELACVVLVLACIFASVGWLLAHKSRYGCVLS